MLEYLFSDVVFRIPQWVTILPLVIFIVLMVYTLLWVIADSFVLNRTEKLHDSVKRLWEASEDHYDTRDQFQDSTWAVESKVNRQIEDLKKQIDEINERFSSPVDLSKPSGSFTPTNLENTRSTDNENY